LPRFDTKARLKYATRSRNCKTPRGVWIETVQALAHFRLVIKRIKDNSEISDSQRIELGLAPRCDLGGASRAFPRLPRIRC